MKSPLCRISKASNANALALIKMRNFCIFFFVVCWQAIYVHSLLRNFNGHRSFIHEPKSLLFGLKYVLKKNLHVF